MDRIQLSRTASASLGWVFIAFLILVPWVFIFVPGIDEHDSARWVQVLILGYLGLVLLPMSATSTALHVGHRFLALAILVLGAVVACLNAIHPIWAFREMALLSGLVVLSLVLGHLPAKFWSVMTGAVVVSMALYGMLLLLLVLASLATGRWPEPGNLTLGYSNYRLFNHVQTVALPLVIGVGLSSHRGLLKSLALIAAVLGIAFMWHAGARASAVALLTAAVVSALFLGRQGRRFAIALALALLLGGVLGLLLFVALPWSMGIDLPGDAVRAASIVSDSSRLKLWSHAWHLVVESPWWGVGPMHFAAAAYQNPVAAHPHNAVLQLAAEWGLPLTALVLVLLLRPLGQLAATVRRLGNASDAQSTGYASPLMGVALVATLWAAAVDAQVSGNIVMPGAQMWLALLGGWAIAWRAVHSPAPFNVKPTPALRTWSARPCYLAMSALLLWGTWQAWTDWRNLNAVLIHAQHGIHNTKANPRFWSNGWF
jgi:putative inorganic carbon (hco3(-)) transporter